MYFLLKSALSGLLIAAIATIARRLPAAGALIASLPLISMFGMIWLWLETHDTAKMVTHTEATFFYVILSLPMFLLIPWMMRHQISFWMALLAGCLLTVVLYALTMWAGRRAGLPL